MAGNKNSGRKPNPKAKGIVPEGDAVQPSWLTERAKVEWDRIAPELVRLRLLTSADEVEFANYCQCVADLERARAMVTQQVWDRLLSDARRPPIFAQIGDLQDRIHRFATTLGLNPSARESLGARGTAPPRGLEGKIGVKPDLRIVGTKRKKA